MTKKVDDPVYAYKYISKHSYENAVVKLLLPSLIKARFQP